ncbi:MAG TPA: MFS transporter, partial [Nitrososphaerales archaeon]|nr:MFS transporter [Nitrososphaerales archaeon]
IYTFFPLRGSSIGLGDAEIGTVLGVRTAMSALARAPVGYLSARLGRTKLFALTLALPATAGLLIPLSTNFLQLAVIVSLEGTGYGIFLTVSRALVAVSSKPQMRGITMALLDVFGSTGQAFLVLGVGIGAGTFGLSFPFYVMSTTLLLGGIGPLMLLRRAGGGSYRVASESSTGR